MSHCKKPGDSETEIASAPRPGQTSDQKRATGLWVGVRGRVRDRVCLCPHLALSALYLLPPGSSWTQSPLGTTWQAGGSKAEHGVQAATFSALPAPALMPRAARF